MIITGNKIASKVLFSHECSSMYNVMHYNLTQWMNHDAVMWCLNHQYLWASVFPHLMKNPVSRIHRIVINNIINTIYVLIIRNAPDNEHLISWINSPMKNRNWYSVNINGISIFFHAEYNLIIFAGLFTSFWPHLLTLVFYSGRAPSKLTLDLLHQQGYSTYKPYPDQTHGHSVTVPGAPAAWVDTVEKFGSGKVCSLHHSVLENNKFI